jgi:hypothetical protein
MAQRSRTLRSRSLLTLSLCAALPAVASTPSYTVLGPDTQVFGLNNLGVAAGLQSGPNGNTAFTWHNGSFQWLTGPAGSLSTAAMDISDTGVVVGNFYNSSSTDPDTGELVYGPSQGYVYAAGTYSSFSVAAADVTGTYLRGISPNGRYLSGYYSTTTVGGVGFVVDTLDGTLTSFSQGNSLLTIAQGINSLGQVAGSDIQTPPSGGSLVRPAFIGDVETGARTDYSEAGYLRLSFRDISSTGLIAGWGQRVDSALGTTVIEGLLGTAGAFTVFSVAGSTQTYLEALNDQGGFAGNYMLDGVNYAFVSAPVPEAPAAWLLLTGLAALAWRRRSAR